MKKELSKRQRQILKMILAGYSQQEICKILNLHTNTVCSYKRLIMDKWEVETTVELIIEAIRRGYLEIDGIEPKETTIVETTVVTKKIIHTIQRIE